MNRGFSRFTGEEWRCSAKWLPGLFLFLILLCMIWGGIRTNVDQPHRLVIYGFSTQEEVLSRGIFPAFEEAWEAETGKDLILEGVFGPSGTLSVQITQGAPADVAIFSNQRHIDWLKFGKAVDKDTKQLMIAATPLVILTRPGNPKRISDFADLMQPDIQLVHGDPIGSGVGEWAVLAEYGSAYLETGNQNFAEAQLEAIWQNVRLLGSSARTTMALFELGAGDALITYEQDAYLARERSVPLEIIMPQRTILARHYAVIVDKNVTSNERPIVEALLAFILSDEGQQILSDYYFRPATVESDLPIMRSFTEEDLGGWAKAYDRLIENYWKTKIEPDLELVSAVTIQEIGEQ